MDESDEVAVFLGVEGKLIAGPIDLGDGMVGILYDAAPADER